MLDVWKNKRKIKNKGFRIPKITENIINYGLDQADRNT